MGRWNPREAKRHLYDEVQDGIVDIGGPTYRFEAPKRINIIDLVKLKELFGVIKLRGRAEKVRPFCVRSKPLTGIKFDMIGEIQDMILAISGEKRLQLNEANRMKVEDLRRLQELLHIVQQRMGIEDGQAEGTGGSLYRDTASEHDRGTETHGADTSAN